MNLQQAVVALREQLGLTQKNFGERLDAAVRTVASWEAGERVPNGGTLAKMGRFAHESGRRDLYAIFSTEYKRETGQEIDIDDPLLISAARELVHNLGEQWVQRQLESLIRRTQAGQHQLVGPDGTQDEKLEKLERLLVDLRQRHRLPTEIKVDKLARERAEQQGEDYGRAYNHILLANPSLHKALMEELQNTLRGTRFFTEFTEDEERKGGSSGARSK